MIIDYMLTVIYVMFRQLLKLQRSQVPRTHLMYCFMLLFLLAIYACREARQDYQILDFGSFKMIAKKGWNIFREKGIDSYVGGLTNGKDSLWFDYGWYSQQIGNYPDSNSLYVLAIINGLEAMFQRSKTIPGGNVAMSISKIGINYKFYIGGENLSHPDEIITMLRTITFEESDTTKNTNLVFAPYSTQFINSGANIFQSYCANCHNPIREATGPPLNSELLAQRTEEWLMLFFFEREKVTNDTLLLRRVQKYDGRHCYIQPELTRTQLKGLIDYIGR